MTLQNDDFLNFFQLRRHPLIELFHLSNLLQMSNDQRMVDIEFFCSISAGSVSEGGVDSIWVGRYRLLL